MKKRMMYSGLNICSSQRSNHNEYLYTIQNRVNEPPTLTLQGKDTPTDDKIPTKSSSGFFVYDLQRLCDGKIDQYKLASAIGGQCNLINKSRFGDRFSFL